MNDKMKPVDVGAPKLIPLGNLNDHPASYSGMRKALDDSRKGLITTRSTAHPNFVPGYTGDGWEGLKGEWQAWGTSTKK